MPNNAVAQLAENVWITVAGRLAMLFCAFIALPVAGYLLATNVEQGHSNELALVKLEATVTALQVAITALSSDHYAAADAVKDFRLRDEKDAEQDRRLDILERAQDRLGVAK